VPIIWF
jgi:dynein heavy chain